MLIVVVIMTVILIGDLMLRMIYCHPSLLLSGEVKWCFGGCLLISRELLKNDG